MRFSIFQGQDLRTHRRDRPEVTRVSRSWSANDLVSGNLKGYIELLSVEAIRPGWHRAAMRKGRGQGRLDQGGGSGCEEYPGDGPLPVPWEERLEERSYWTVVNEPQVV